MADCGIVNQWGGWWGGGGRGPPGGAVTAFNFFFFVAFFDFFVVGMFIVGLGGIEFLRLDRSSSRLLFRAFLRRLLF